ncbi:hypothetical protein EC12741_B0045 [Escherichia coli 1.2741]|nr:transposase domain-containing protein [Escherichia coli]EIG83256.1 hypothetical protein EC12741_B0045 [Escherichia coli 1.2741]MCW3337243.1 transposase domain-containing protein [Escherichia coli]MCW3346671.1 transposase domain-containing protein [Escherichia coli]
MTLSVFITVISGHDKPQPPGGLLDGVHGVPTVEQGKWLRYVIEHIQDWPTNRVRDLLPWKV